MEWNICWLNRKLLGWITTPVHQEIPEINIEIIIIPVNRKLLGKMTILVYDEIPEINSCSKFFLIC